MHGNNPFGGGGPNQLPHNFPIGPARPQNMRHQPVNNPNLPNAVAVRMLAGPHR